MRLSYNKYLILLAGIILSLCGVSCLKNPGQDIYTTINFELKMPGGENILKMEIDKSVEGNFFRNFNTGQDMDFPVFVNGKGTIQTIKGLYLIAFDSEALLTDGTTKKVRFTGHNSPDKALSLLQDEEYVELKLTVLK